MLRSGTPQPGTAGSLSHKLWVLCWTVLVAGWVLQDSAAFHHLSQGRVLVCPVQECFDSRVAEAASTSLTVKNSLRGWMTKDYRFCTVILLNGSTSAAKDSTVCLVCKGWAVQIITGPTGFEASLCTKLHCGGWSGREENRSNKCSHQLSFIPPFLLHCSALMPDLDSYSPADRSKHTNILTQRWCDTPGKEQTRQDSRVKPECWASTCSLLPSFWHESSTRQAETQLTPQGEQQWGHCLSSLSPCGGSFCFGTGMMCISSPCQYGWW